MIDSAMKRDGRTLDHGTLETIRKMAVERPSEVIASYGFHRCTIYGWLKVARGRGKGLKALPSVISQPLRIAVGAALSGVHQRHFAG